MYILAVLTVFLLNVNSAFAAVGVTLSSPKQSLFGSLTVDVTGTDQTQKIIKIEVKDAADAVKGVIFDDTLAAIQGAPNYFESFLLKVEQAKFHMVNMPFTLLGMKLAVTVDKVTPADRVDGTAATADTGPIKFDVKLQKKAESKIFTDAGKLYVATPDLEMGKAAEIAYKDKEGTPAPPKVSNVAICKVSSCAIDAIPTADGDITIDGVKMKFVLKDTKFTIEEDIGKLPERTIMLITNKPGTTAGEVYDVSSTAVIHMKKNIKFKGCSKEGIIRWEVEDSEKVEKLVAYVFQGLDTETDFTKAFECAKKDGKMDCAIDAAVKDLIKEAKLTEVIITEPTKTKEFLFKFVTEVSDGKSKLEGPSGYVSIEDITKGTLSGGTNLLVIIIPIVVIVVVGALIGGFFIFRKNK